MIWDLLTLTWNNREGSEALSPLEVLRLSGWQKVDTFAKQEQIAGLFLCSTVQIGL